MSPFGAVLDGTVRELRIGAELKRARAAAAANEWIASNGMAKIARAMGVPTGTTTLFLAVTSPAAAHEINMLSSMLRGHIERECPNVVTTIRTQTTSNLPRLPEAAVASQPVRIPPTLTDDELRQVAPEAVTTVESICNPDLRAAAMRVLAGAMKWRKTQ